MIHSLPLPLSLLSHLLLLPSLVLITSPSPLLAFASPICPGVLDCAHYAVEPLMGLDGGGSGGRQNAASLVGCQNLCQDSGHAFYSFLASKGKKGSCFCFNSCSALVPGETIVGSVRSCKAKLLLRLRGTLHGHEGWAQDPERPAGGSTRRQSGAVEEGDSLGGAMDDGDGSTQDVERKVEEQEQLMLSQEQQSQELMRLQQEKQLASQQGLGWWETLHRQLTALQMKQQRFLEREHELEHEQQQQGSRASGLALPSGRGRGGSLRLGEDGKTEEFRQVSASRGDQANEAGVHKVDTVGLEEQMKTSPWSD